MNISWKKLFQEKIKQFSNLIETTSMICDKK